MVGEQGVELFTPDRNGSIIPNDKLGAGPTSVTNNFGGITINDRGDVDYFMEKLARVMQLGKL